VKEQLAERGLILGRQATIQSVRVHERCDTPVEMVVSAQWFVRVLDEKEALLRLGEQIHWHPEHMQARYRAWVENLNWDWAVSRQRTFGVPFPAWYCVQCGETL
ncbi:MAG TPA: class I tRNA ligase family protein, partial [Anaerolinea sp.]|nr:class I tRNA ligase family protein [Anaerolinea sp.]